MSAPLPRFAVEGERYRALLPAMRGVARDPQTARLARAIALADGFMLHLIGCESHQAAEALLLCLATLLKELRGHPLELAYLAPTHPDEGPLQPEELAREVFERLLAPDPEPRAVFLDATDCTEADRPAWRYVLQRLNERRNHLPAVQAPLTLLLPLDLERELPALAPDLWSIRSVGARYTGLLSLPGSRTLEPFPGEPRSELDYDVEALRAELESLLAQPGPAARRAAVAVFGRLAAGLAEQGQSQEAMTLLQERMLPSLSECPLAEADRLRFELVRVVLPVVSAAELESLVRQVALPAAERLGEEAAATQTLVAVANAYGLVRDYERAARILENEVLPRASELPDRTYEADQLAKLAVTRFLQGQREAGEQLLKQLLNPSSAKPSSSTRVAQVFWALAEVQLAEGRATDAIETLRHKLIPLYHQIQNEDLKASGWVRLGQAHAMRGEHHSALEVWRDKALPAYARLSRRDGVALVQGLIARALLDLGRPEAAVAYLRRKALPLIAKPAQSPIATRERREALDLHAAAFDALGKHEAARRIRAAAKLPPEQDLTAVLAEAASAENPAAPSLATPVLHTAAGPEVFDSLSERATALGAPP